MKCYIFSFFLFVVIFLNSNFLSNNDFEKFNRRIYAFNRGVDQILLNPLTEIYINIFPSYLKARVDDFFLNLHELQVLVFMLSKCDYFSIYRFSKVFINSTAGFFGFFNLFLDSSIIKNELCINNKFFSNKYIILPVIGPATINCSFNLLILQLLNPIFYYTGDLLFYYLIEIINKKNSMFFDSNFFHSSTADGYSFLKIIFFQYYKKECL